MRKTVEIILCDTEEEYRKEYAKIFLKQKIFFKDILVKFSIEDFNHIFFEPSKDNNKYEFSFRRAKRMVFIKEILEGNIPSELMFQPDRGTFALFCNDLESVVYLRIRPKIGLQVGTFFDFGKGHSKMENKQKRKCVPIPAKKMKEMI